MTVNERRKRRFSEPLRKELVIKIESGELSISDISKLYEVKSSSIKRWIMRFGKSKLPLPVVIQSYSELNRVRELEKALKNTKLIVGELQIKIIHLEEINRLAKEKLGLDFEKKIKK